jgi:hypothetical protein
MTRASASETHGMNIFSETMAMAEYYERLANARGAEIAIQIDTIEHLLGVVRSAYDSLTDDNNSASAEAVLRVCLKRFGR